MKAASKRRRRRNQEEGDTIEIPIGIPVECETVTVNAQGVLTGITVADESLTVGEAQNPRRRTVRIKRRRR